MWLHCSFWSTGACKTSHVNAINACSLCAHQKERGGALLKRSWAIEMSESRQLHLATCGKVDRIDHMVKNCNICCRHAIEILLLVVLSALLTHADASFEIVEMLA